MNFSFFLGSFVLGVIMVIVGMVILVSQRFHFLMSLLSFEFMVLGLVVTVLGFVGWSCDGYLVFVILTFASCEAALGLGLLVSLVRSHGSDFMSVVSVYEC